MADLSVLCSAEYILKHTHHELLISISCAESEDCRGVMCSVMFLLKRRLFKVAVHAECCSL